MGKAEAENYVADGEQLIFVTVSSADKNDVFVPTCHENLTFSVSGEGRFEAVCNGDATSLQSFKQPEMKLFNGQLVVVLRTTTKAGDVTLTVRDKRGKLKPAVVTLRTR